MCTGIYRFGEHPLFGRNLDLDMSYGEKPLFVPRGASIPTHHEGQIVPSYAMLGTGLYLFGRPLYFDAMNEKGLAVAGLNFPGYAKEGKPADGKVNLTPYEFIPYLLGRYASLEEAMPFLERLNFTDEAVDPSMPIAPLHYLIADLHKAIVLEAAADGVRLYSNPYGVLTNNPPFPFMEEILRRYLNVSSAYPANRFGSSLTPTSVGMGSIGLPGDYSSSSRFVKAAFLNLNVASSEDEEEAFHRFYGILDSVAFLPGTAYNENGKSETTVYQAMMDLSRGKYSIRHRQSEAPRIISFSDLDLKGKAIELL